MRISVMDRPVLAPKLLLPFFPVNRLFVININETSIETLKLQDV
jgi:hypothetical protein